MAPGGEREWEKTKIKKGRRKKNPNKCHNRILFSPQLSLSLSPWSFFPKMQALASSRGVRVAPSRAALASPKQQRVVVAAAAAAPRRRSNLPIASSRSNAGVVALSAVLRPTPSREAPRAIAAAAAASNNVPLVTRDEGPISEEAFSVR
mgnify:CR=1 FL=1